MSLLRWGAVLAVVLIGLVVLVTVLRPAVTEAGFVKAEQALRQTIRLLEAGRIDEAERVFLAEADPLFHRLDPVLRSKDPELAEELWGIMGRIELAFYHKQDLEPESLARMIETSIPRLREAAERLNMDPAWTSE